MRLLFTSDLHGELSAYKRFSDLLASGRYDVGVISGDLMTFTDSPRQAEERCKDILRAARRPVFFLMGNDDGLLGAQWTDDGLVRSLHGHRIVSGGLAFVGYQYTSPFVGGPFERTESDQASDLESLKPLVDTNTVLVTHGPPYGILDQLTGGRSVGSRSLRIFVDGVRPKLHLFGHIHSSFGFTGASVNGSYPDKRRFMDVEVETLAVVETG